MEYASWSPDSRLMIESYRTRFDTDALRLFAFDKAGGLAGSLDILPLVRDAVVAKARQRYRNAESLSFVVATVPVRSTMLKDGVYPAMDSRLANDGHVRLGVYLWTPKEGPFHHYEVTLSLARAPALAAKVLAVAPRRPPHGF
jgi:hypothetical protein